MIDVRADVEIATAPSAIAGVMFDPQRYAEWMEAVERVEILDKALAPGARVRHHGSFMGRPIAWTTEVETVHFPHVLILKMIDGPFVGTARIGIQRSSGGSRVQVQKSGELTDFPFVPEAMVAGPLTAALQSDLDRLKAIIEAM